MVLPQSLRLEHVLNKRIRKQTEQSCSNHGEHELGIWIGRLARVHQHLVPDALLAGGQEQATNVREVEQATKQRTVMTCGETNKQKTVK